MNLQTEIQEKRVAQLKVEVESDVLDRAKRTAARTLAKRVNIPGFRKGKAPYDIIARYLGEGAILDEAIDELGPKVYREAIEEADLDPYGPGQLENIEGDGPLTFTFKVPLNPVIELGEYRAVRHPYEAPEITDERVEEVLQLMVSNQAKTEVKEGPAAPGDGVKINVHGFLQIDAAEADAEPAEASEEADAEGETPEAVDPDLDRELLFDQHDWAFVLGEEVREPMPGFSAALEGLTAGEERKFDLVFPTEGDDFDESLRGKTVNFEVTCEEVTSREVPELNDEFVKNLEEEEAETVDELREKIRADLEQSTRERAENEYAQAALDLVVEGASVDYPDAMIEDYIDDMVKNFEQQLSQQGLTLENFLSMTHTTQEALREQYRESAQRGLKRSLVLSELFNAEELAIQEAHISSEVKSRAIQLSRGNEQMRELFEQYLGGTQARRDIGLELMTRHTYNRLAAIARGEEPPTGPEPEPEPEPEPVVEAAAIEEPVVEAADVAEAEAAESAETLDAVAQEAVPATDDTQPEADTSEAAKEE